MTVAEIAMTVADEIRDHQERCQPFLLRLRMIVRGEAEAALSRPVASEVGQSTNAIIAEAEAAGRAALAAVGDSHRVAAAGNGVADSGLGGSGPDRAWPPPGPRRRAPHRGLAIAAAVVAVAAAMVASVAVISAVHSTKTTPATLAAGGGAGQPLVAVGIGAVLALELVTSAGGDLLVIQLTGDEVITEPGGRGDQRLGQGRVVPGSLDEDGAAGAGLDAGLVVAVVHDGLVAQRSGREVEATGERLGLGAVVAEPAGLVAAGGGKGQDPGAGAAGVFAGPGQGHADGEVGVRGRAPGGRAVAAMVASSAQEIR